MTLSLLKRRLARRSLAGDRHRYINDAALASFAELRRRRSETPEISTWFSRHHEAGHVVVASLLGVEFVDVVVDKGFTDRGSSVAVPHIPHRSVDRLVFLLSGLAAQRAYGQDDGGNIDRYPFHESDLQLVQDELVKSRHNLGGKPLAFTHNKDEGALLARWADVLGTVDLLVEYLSVVIDTEPSLRRAIRSVHHDLQRHGDRLSAERVGELVERAFGHAGGVEERGRVAEALRDAVRFALQADRHYDYE